MVIVVVDGCCLFLNTFVFKASTEGFDEKKKNGGFCSELNLCGRKLA